MRIHKTLELADDKFYMITCGKAGFQVSIYSLLNIGMVVVVVVVVVVVA